MQDLAKQLGTTAPILQQLGETAKSTSEDNNEESSRPKYPMPDISQMIPFKPRVVVRKFMYYIIYRNDYTTVRFILSSTYLSYTLSLC